MIPNEILEEAGTKITKQNSSDITKNLRIHMKGQRAETDSLIKHPRQLESSGGPSNILPILGELQIEDTIHNENEKNNKVSCLFFPNNCID